MKYYLWKILIQIAPSSTELYKTTKKMTQVFCLFYLFTSYKLYVGSPYIWDISLSTLNKFRTAGTWIWIQKITPWVMFHIMPIMMLLTRFTLDIVQIEAGTGWANFFDDNSKCIFGDDEVSILFKFHCSLFINQRAEHWITRNRI